MSTKFLVALDECPGGIPYFSATSEDLSRKRDTTTPETRVTALVPRKCKTLDIIRKDSEKNMKVHNTRRKATTPTVMDAKISISPGTSSARTTGLTSSDWLEIMECEVEVD
ncbi:40267_t:CDS:2 [Gigaspora margarita]|uniref:40267_t:CDS:1 n=1 Tax=Gigaspora margarita TaxID=4874 RepID=A0ABN7URH2_GIGMA|nr:40267_t:CDS:2 [Gigaspora margarita]